MTQSPYACDYLTDLRNRVLFSQTPLLLMPRYGALAPPALGRRRYVSAADGMYVQARSRALDLTLKLPEPQLPFGPLQEHVHLPGGLIPRSIYREIERQVLEHSPNEWAGLVHWREEEQRYALTVPQTLDRSAGHIRYDSSAIDRDTLVLDVHSHGEAAAYFSAVDDQSDEFGFYFAAVFGQCQSTDTLTVLTRLVVDGHRFALSWHPWEAED